MQKGILVNVFDRGLSFSGKYSLTLIKPDDGLIHRPRSNWVGHYTNCELGGTDVWFQSVCSPEDEEESGDEEAVAAADDDPNRPPPSVASGGAASSSGGQHQRRIEKSFFLSIDSIQYNREIGAALVPQNNSTLTAAVVAETAESPNNFLTVSGARGAWTISNRDLALALYASWRRAHLLRSQLSEMNDNSVKPQQAVSSSPTEDDSWVAQTPASAPKPSTSAVSPSLGTPSTEELSLSNLNGWGVGSGGSDHVTAVADVNSISFSTVYSEDQQYPTAKDKELEAKRACSKEDALRRTWVVKFVNCQMLLKGTETEGYIIIR